MDSMFCRMVMGMQLQNLRIQHKDKLHECCRSRVYNKLNKLPDTTLSGILSYYANSSTD